MNERDCGQAPSRFIDGGVQVGIVRRSRLQCQEARYKLQAVLHTVVHLSNQELLLTYQEFLFLDRVHELTVEVANASRLPYADHCGPESTGRFDFRKGPGAGAATHGFAPSVKAGS